MLPLSRYARPLRVALWTVVLTLAGSELAAAPASASLNSQQRQQFMRAWPLAQQGDDGWRASANGLQNYVLFPYLEAAALQHDLKQLDPAEVDAFNRRYPDSIPGADLNRAMLRELARRQDWPAFLARYQAGTGTELSCFALQARLAAGQSLDFSRDLASLWTQASLPNACDPVLSAARAQGLLTPSRLWQRIDQAVQAGAGATVASLASALPSEQQDEALHLAQALRDPSAALAAASHWSDSARHREAVTLAISRQARRDSSAAEQAWLGLRAQFQLSPAQIGRIQYALALYAAADYRDDALARLAALPASLQTSATRAWAVRVALARQDWPAVLHAIQAMPDSERNDAEWRYFEARARAASGQAQAAQAIYAELAKQATYYGFLAADRGQQNYQICPATPLDDRDAQQQLLQASVGLQRAMELAAVGLTWQARREWNKAMSGRDQATRNQAALLAWHQGWFDRAISQFSSGPGLHFYSQRFPLAASDGVVAQAEQAGVDPAWAYAVIRAESAWMPDAHSGADAWGLMQLVPATGRQLAQTLGMPWNGTASLLDPVTNVTLGTRYLAQLASRYQGAPWLTSVAYNAGPQNLQRWLEARPSLDPDVFIATIPFHETRQYATQILSFAVFYDWRLHQRVQRISQRMPALGTADSSQPDLSPVRVECQPMPEQAAHASNSATPESQP